MNLVFLIGIVITLATGIPVFNQLRKTHPKGLMILFFAEMWERFSYYGMRGLLVFYLTQHLLFDQKAASSQYGSYTSLVYLLPLLGGMIADRWLGMRKAVAFGAQLLVAGHLTMAYEGKPATQTLTYAGQAYEVTAAGRMEDLKARLIVAGKPYEFGPAKTGGLEIKDLPVGSTLPSILPEGAFKMSAKQDKTGVNAFYLAVSLIIMGVGFLKPNISSIVGQLYPQGDPRRDAGFTLYYYGVNLGAFWAAIVCGLLGQYVGWWAGFGAAGVGMALGWVAFMLGRPMLQGKGEPPNPEQLAAPYIGPLNREWLIYILGLAGVGLVWLLVPRNDLVGKALIASILGSAGFVIYIIAKVCQTWQERQRMFLAVILVLGAVVFFTLFEQAGTSLSLFASTNVDLSITQSAGTFLGIPYGSHAQLAAAGVTPSGTFSWIDTGIGAAQTQTFNAGFILLFAPLFAALWTWLGARGMDPNPTLKFGLGLVQVGLGFMVVVWGAGLHDAAFKMPLILLALLYMLHTTGELFLSPVGLSQITKLAMPTVVSFMMAVWFLASSVAQFVGGAIAGMAGTETVGGQVLDPGAALAASVRVFNMLGTAGMVIGVAFIALSFVTKTWGNGVAVAADDGPLA